MVRLCGDAWAPDEGIEVILPTDLPLRDSRELLADALQLPDSRDVFRYHMWTIEEPEDYDDIDDPLLLEKVRKLSIYGSLNSQGLKQNNSIYFTKEVLSPKVEADRSLGPLSAVEPPVDEAPGVTRNVLFGGPSQSRWDESPKFASTQSWVEAQSGSDRGHRSRSKSRTLGDTPTLPRQPLQTVAASAANAAATDPAAKCAGESTGLSSVSTSASSAHAPSGLKQTVPGTTASPHSCDVADSQPQPHAASPLPSLPSEPVPKTRIMLPPAEQSPDRRAQHVAEENEATGCAPPSASKMSKPTIRQTEGYNWRTVITAELRPARTASSDTSSMAADPEELELEVLPSPNAGIDPRVPAECTAEDADDAAACDDAAQSEASSQAPELSSRYENDDIPEFKKGIPVGEVNCAFCTTCQML